MLQRVILLLSLAGFAASQTGNWSAPLNCGGKLTDPKLANNWFKFGRPLKSGDVLTLEGKFPSVIGQASASINLLHDYAFIFHSLHMRFDTNAIVYTYSSANAWAPPSAAQVSPQSFVGGKPFKIVIKKFYDYYEIYNDKTLIQSFKFRHSPDTAVGWLLPFLHIEVTSIQLDCVTK